MCSVGKSSWSTARVLTVAISNINLKGGTGTDAGTDTGTCTDIDTSTDADTGTDTHRQTHTHTHKQRYPLMSVPLAHIFRSLQKVRTHCNALAD